MHDDLIALRDRWEARAKGHSPPTDAHSAGYVIAVFGFIADLNSLIASKKEKPASGVASNG